MATRSLAAILGHFLVAAPASAKPDACPVSSSTSTATCQGNQSQGVEDGTDFPATTTVTVQNLSGGMFPVAGNSGILHFAQPGSGIGTIVVNFTGPGGNVVGIQAISTTSASAHGILAGGQGKTSGTLGGLTVRSTGVISTKGSGSFPSHGVFANAISGGSAAGSNGTTGSGDSGGSGAGGTTIAVSGSGVIQADGDGSSGIVVSGSGGRWSRC